MAPLKAFQKLQGNMFPEDCLDQEVGEMAMDLLHNSDYADFRKLTTVLKEPSRKWRCSSAMQKSIRRGHASMAARACCAIYSVDKVMVWRRITETAFEDVSVGDPDSVNMVSWAFANRRDLARQGLDRHMAIVLAARLANAKAKTRVLGCCPPHYRALSLGGSVDLSPEPSRGEHALVNLSRMGQFDRRVSKEIEGCGNRFDDLSPLVYREVSNPAHRYMIIKGASIGRGWFCMGVLPVVWAMEADQPEVREGSDPEGDELIDGIPSAAFDWHTREGRKAYAYLSKSCAPVREIFEAHPKANKVEAVQEALWHFETPFLNREVSNQAMDEIASAFWGLRSRDMGLDEFLPDLVEALKGCREDINYARRRVVLGKEGADS